MVRRRYVAAGAIGVITVPFAAWWLIGDLSVPERYPGQLEYIAYAPHLPAAIGTVALATTVVAIGVLTVGARQRQVDGRGLGALLLLTSAGVVLAAIGRVATAGTVGANIGGGVAVTLGLPLVVVLIAGAVALLLSHPVRADG